MWLVYVVTQIYLGNHIYQPHLPTSTHIYPHRTFPPPTYTFAKKITKIEISTFPTFSDIFPGKQNGFLKKGVPGNRLPVPAIPAGTHFPLRIPSEKDPDFQNFPLRGNERGPAGKRERRMILYKGRARRSVLSADFSPARGGRIYEDGIGEIWEIPENPGGIPEKFPDNPGKSPGKSGKTFLPKQIVWGNNFPGGACVVKKWNFWGGGPPPFLAEFWPRSEFSFLNKCF